MSDLETPSNPTECELIFSEVRTDFKVIDSRGSVNPIADVIKEYPREKLLERYHY